MTRGIASTASEASELPPQAGVRMPFDAIDSPGAYVCNWSGHLMRIPERTVVPEDAHKLNIVGREPLMVTKISDDPGVPLAEAREIAARLGIDTSF